MRISDWSSDVCSSDLLHGDDVTVRQHLLDLRQVEVGGSAALADRSDHARLVGLRGVVDQHLEQEAVELRLGERIRAFLFDRVLRGQRHERRRQRERSEEHTSELQSLKRNSYAVFCLKNTTHKQET